MITVETYQTASEAARALSSGAQYHGGGTLLMRAVNYGADGFDRIVRTSDPSLKEIRMAGDRLVLGAGVTMADVLRSREAEYLAPAARSVGGPAVRNAATVGGNLFAPHPYGDFATALLALDGVVRLTDGRDMPLDRLLAARDGFTGVVQSISVVKPERGTFRFNKVSRVKPSGISVMTIAALLPTSAGRLAGVRLAFGAMGPMPLRATNTEQAFEGGSLDEATVSRAVEALSRDLQPFDDAIASGWYRREVASVHLKRLLLERGV